MSHGPRQFTRNRRLLPAELGFDGITFATEQTSNSIAPDGYTHLMLYCSTAAYAAAADISIAVDVSNDAGTTWHPLQAGALAAGIRTLTDLIDRHAVGAADQWKVSIDIDDALLRIRVSDSTGGATTDTVTISGRLSAR